MPDSASQKFTANLVSIIMPAYNSSKTIGESIRSVQSQTYPNWELIVVDDCSEENLQSVLSAYHDERIRYYRFSQNQGVAAARNRGMELACGQYVAFLDSDDIWHPQKLAEQIAFMQKNHYKFTYTWYRQFSGDISHQGNLIKTKPWVDYKKLLKGNDIGCLTVMIDRKKISDIKMPNQRHEDYITWLNILKTGIKAYSLPEELAYYRKDTNSLTGNKWTSMIWTWRVYHRNQRLSWVRSFYYMFFYIISGIKKHH